MDCQQSMFSLRPEVPVINVSIPQQSTSNTVRRQPSPSRDQSPNRSTLTSHSSAPAQLTPPLTPKYNQNISSPSEGENHSAFHNYLRAFYPFHPTSTVSSVSEESSITVPIDEGDVILVHSIQPNGWADGTLLASGARGWLPTNYCEAYDHDAVRNLLNALTYVWEFLRGNEDGDPSVYVRQDYVRGMIAGVRCFLERSNCLNRDSPLVQGHVGIRRMRKGLLGDLSSFVKAAKKLQEVCHEQITADALYDLLDDIILKGFKVVTRAVRFLDIWTQDVVLKQCVEVTNTFDAHPLTPPMELAAAAANKSNAASSSILPVDTSLPPVSPEEYATPLESFPVDSSPLDNTIPQISLNRQSIPEFATSRPKSLLYKRASAAHRISYSGLPNAERTTVLASERLKAAYDAFLGYAGTFVGGLPQHRTSVELCTTTKQAADACKMLLAVVEEVYERDYRRSQPLIDARNAMDARLQELVRAVGEIFDSEAKEDADLFMPGPGNRLADTAIACVRAAGACSTMTSTVIARIGDFDFDPVGLGISTDIAQSSLVELVQPTSSTEQLDMSKPLPAPPQPTEKPPPPPAATTASSSEDIEADAQLSWPFTVPRLSSETITRDGLSETQASAATAAPARMSFAGLNVDIPASSPIHLSQAFPEPEEDLSRRSDRGDSVGMSMTDSFSTCEASVRHSEMSVVSQTSTRATTPDGSPSKERPMNSLLGSFSSLSECQSTIAEEGEDGELQFLAETHAHELMYNKEGNIIGGSLPALVEMLTTRDSTPDIMFVNTFYLTFRLFTTPKEFAQALVDRYDYVGTNDDFARPVRLRVYNVFKGWLESHWRSDTDNEALPDIHNFAAGRLSESWPNASKRLIDLTTKVSDPQDGAIVPKLVSAIGRNASATGLSSDVSMPNPSITKGQLNLLKGGKNGVTCTILDFDAVELARQFTLIESRIFCSIQPEELLALEWTKKSESRAVNVHAMSSLSTDLANLVADSILHFEDPKKRAATIKQWVKIAKRCLELNNYDSLMAIICSLNSSMVMRLKKTWDAVNPKTLLRLQELKAIVDISKNYAVLRQRLQGHVAPCLPFVGIYLTDLTFVDVGNQNTRQMPMDGNNEPATVINFDKHVRTAKIISDLQRFQIPYRLQPVPELQEWMEGQIRRVRNGKEDNLQHYYRRSLLLEPRDVQSAPKMSPNEASSSTTFPANPIKESSTKEKFEFWSTKHFPSAMTSKEKLSS